MKFYLLVCHSHIHLTTKRQLINIISKHAEVILYILCHFDVIAIILQNADIFDRAKIARWSSQKVSNFAVLRVINWHLLDTCRHERELHNKISSDC